MIPVHTKYPQVSCNNHRNKSFKRNVFISIFHDFLLSVICYTVSEKECIKLTSIHFTAGLREKQYFLISLEYTP